MKTLVIPRQAARYPHGSASRVTALIACGLSLFAAAASAADYVSLPGTPAVKRLLVVPFAEPTGVILRDGPNGTPWRQQPWMTAGLVQQAFFQRNFAPTLPDGSPGTSGSIADFWSRQFLGQTMTGTVLSYANGTHVDGLYQLSISAADAGTLTGEPLFWQSMRILLARNGYGVLAGVRTTPLPGMRNASPLMDAKLRNNVDGIAFISPGGGGATRYPDGVPVCHAGMGLQPTVDYNWMGTHFHEVGHLLWDLRDYYWPGLEDFHSWNVMSVGERNAFPSPVTPLVRFYEEQPRQEVRMMRGLSEQTPLHAHNPANTLVLPQIMVLPNGTVSNAGNDDVLLVEHRERAPAMPWDTGFNFLQAGNEQGLFVQSYDAMQTGIFFGGNNEVGQLPPAFSQPVEHWNGGYILNSSSLLRGANDAWSEVGHLFTPTSPLIGSSYGTAGKLERWRSSANRDGDVIWELLPQAGTGTTFVNARYQGTSVVGRIAVLGNATSAVGTMPVQDTPAAGGWMQRVTVNGSSALQIFSNSTVPSYSATLRFAHNTHANGEVMTATLSLPLLNSSVPGLSTWQRLAGSSVNCTINVSSAGTLLRSITTRLNSPQWRQTLHVDLTDTAQLAGRPVNIEIVLTGARPFAVQLEDAWLFRKGETVLRDLAAELRAGAAAVNFTRTEATGFVGYADSVLLEDGVTYDRSLAMKPRTAARGKVERSVHLSVPATGALLRGSVGYAMQSLASDGAILRLSLDDGKHRFAITGNAPPVIEQGATFVLPSESGAAPTGVEWGRGLAWTGSGAGDGWHDGDIVRKGDVNGDGADDLIIFTSGARPRVLVASSTRSRFNEPAVWLTGFFDQGDRCYTGDFNGDGRADIIRITQAGYIDGAQSSGGSFTAAHRSYPVALVALDEVVQVADFNGDRCDDLIVFTLRGGARAAGTVRLVPGLRTGSFGTPATIGTGVCTVTDTPLVGRIDTDTLADVVVISATGTVTVHTSIGTRLGSRRVVLNGGPTHNTADPIANGEQVHPGSRYTTGAVPFLGRRDGVAALYWFNRTSITGGPAGDVMNAAWDYATATFAAPQRLHEWFGINDEWVMIGDFTGDGNSDAMTMQLSFGYSGGPSRPAKNLMRRQPFWPGDMYVSPKLSQNCRNETLINDVAARKRRLNRFEVDLSRLAGRDIDLIIEIDAGPTATQDVVLFPQLKLYGVAQPVTSSPFTMIANVGKFTRVAYSLAANDYSETPWKLLATNDGINWNEPPVKPQQQDGIVFWDVPLSGKPEKYQIVEDLPVIDPNAGSTKK